MAQVGHVLEVVVCGCARRADFVKDFGAEFCIDLGVVGEFVEGPRERCGGGVAAGEEDGDDLVADGLGVAGVVC